MKRPSDVFTPRAAVVNAAMYVRRPKLEERLIDAIDSNKYIVIHGESGNGKTWLYKQVFRENEVHFEVVNLAQTKIAGSIEGALRQKLGELGYRQTQTTETVSKAGARPMGIGIDYESKVQEVHVAAGAFRALLQLVADRARGLKPVLVLDNFESIIADDDALQELAAIIISADDESVARWGVQVVIVGVPGNLKETITKLANSTPVANRLTELPEVARMSSEEATDLIKRGLLDELKLEISPDVADSLFGEVCWLTDRIAQHIHEFCLILANKAVRNGSKINREIVEAAIEVWADDSLSSDLGIIEGVMNARETKAGRKNQVLYAMGQCNLEDFKYTDIEKIVRDNFDVRGAALNVSQILSGFAAASNPLIRRTPKQDAWRFVSPKLKMAIRARLVKNGDKVSVRQNAT